MKNSGGFLYIFLAFSHIRLCNAFALNRTGGLPGFFRLQSFFHFVLSFTEDLERIFGKRKHKVEEALKPKKSRKSTSAVKSKGVTKPAVTKGEENVKKSA